MHTVVDPGVDDLNCRGVLDVDTVGVGAERRRADGEAVDEHPRAVVELEVELRAVLDPQAAHRHAVAQEESYQLWQKHTNRVRPRTPTEKTERNPSPRGGRRRRAYRRAVTWSGQRRSVGALIHKHRHDQ